MQHYILRLAIAVSTFLAGLVFASMLNPFLPQGVADEKAQQEILQTEREYIQAHLDRDVTTLDSILADEFVIATKHRQLTDKAQRLTLLGNMDFAFEAIQTDDVKVEVSGNTAVVSGEANLRGRYGERRFTSRPYRFTREYEKRDGRWQILAVRIAR
jgi:ketosteroid isomerase-like protein